VFCILSWRVFWMTMLNRSTPNANPSLALTTIETALLDRLVPDHNEPWWDPTFSEHSYGFRPGRSAHQAVAQAQTYVIEGCRFVVDIDLAKFFDRVNHDRLLAAVGKRVSDRRVLRLIRGYLTAGYAEKHVLQLFDQNRTARRLPRTRQ
jgi:retron-type reverse transcriptase